MKIAHSPTIIEALYDICKTLGVDKKRMIADVLTHWNSTAELVQRALELHAALDHLVLMPEFNKPKGVRLERFRLLPGEWKLLGELSPVLDVSFKSSCSFC